MDQLIREGNPPAGQLASPVPQVWDPTANGGAGGWVRVYGEHHASRAILYGPNGQPISTANRLPVEATLSGSIPSFFPAQPAVITATLHPLAAGETRQLADVRAACVIEAITLIVPLNDVKILWRLDRYTAGQSTTIPYWQFVDNYAASPMSGITMGQIKYAGGLFGFRFGTNASNEADIAQSVTPIYCPYGFLLRAVNTVTNSHAWGRAVVAYRVVS